MLSTLKAQQRDMFFYASFLLHLTRPYAYTSEAYTAKLPYSDFINVLTQSFWQKMSHATHFDCASSRLGGE